MVALLSRIHLQSIKVLSFSPGNYVSALQDYNPPISLMFETYFSVSTNEPR